MVTGDLPFLTKGPFAIFFGGAAIIPQLSSEPAGNHFSILFLASMGLHIIMIIFKKLKKKTLPTQQRLKEIVVGNFLNVFSSLLILAVLSVLTFGLLNHFYTIHKNSAVPEEKIQKSPKEFWKNLLVLNMVETMFQSFSFLTNPALR